MKVKASWKENRWILVCLAVIILLSALLGVLVVGSHGPLLGAPLTVTYSRYSASADSGPLVEPDSQLLVAGRSDWSLERMRAGTRLEPATPFTLRLDGESGNYVVTPTLPLPAGQEVTLYVENASVTFRTAPTLLVLGHSPRNGSTGVNTKSGIALQFSVPADQLDLTALEAAVTVEPPVLLRFTGSGSDKVHSFADEAIQPNTTYTVTISGDFASKDGLKLREPYRFSFTTLNDMEMRTGHLFTLAGWGKNPAYNTLPDTAPAIEAYFDATALVDGQPPQLEVNLYAIPDEERYLTELKAAYDSTDIYATYQPTTLEGLTVQSSFTMQPISLGQENSWRGGYILPFPEALAEGRYLAEFTMNSTVQNADGTPYLLKRYLLVQSSPMAVFFMHSDQDLALWLNDTTTGQPMADATFDIWGDVNGYGKTGADGIAFISDPLLAAPQWDSASVFAIRSGDHTYLDGRFFGMDYNYGDPQLDYTGYLFTDRPVYMTTDTIQVWGVARPRPGNRIADPVFTLSMRDSDQTQTIIPDEKGFFRATLQLEGQMPYDWMTLRLDLNGEQLAYQTLRVYDYVKPVYTSTSSTTQPVYVTSRGEQPQLSLNVSLYDGTAVEGYRAKAGERWGNDLLCSPATVTTDKSGNATTLVTIAEPLNSWWPVNYNYAFTSGEDENYVASGYLWVIHRDLMLRGTAQRQNDKATATITTNTIDTRRVKSPADLSDVETLKGGTMDTTVVAKLMRVEHQQKLAGTSYDYINRVTVPRYTYERVETVEKTYTLETKNGVATLSDLPIREDDNVYYYLLLTAKDSAGLTVEYTLWLDMEQYPGQDTTDRYSLQKVLDPSALQGNETISGYGYDESWWQRYRFGDGEEVTFQLLNRDVPVEGFKGRLLTATTQRGIDNLSVTDVPSRTLAFDDTLTPNYNISGAYFDGRSIVQVESAAMTFDEEDRRLDIALVTDKESYRPGDTVTVTAKVTRQIDGQPAPDSTLLLSVVDEAVFALAEQSTDILERFYYPIFSPYVTVYLSQNGPAYLGPGEMGGGGGDDPIREKFEDTAHFNTAVTDQDGNATFRFTLPDNIGSWRLTALTLNDQNFAGGMKQNTISTKDFYLLPRMNSQLVAGDTLTIGLKGAGSGVTNEDTVQYTATLEGPVTGRQTLSGQLREDSWVQFLALTPGQYTVTLHGQCRDWSDTLRLPLTVLPTGLEVTRSQTFDLTRDNLATLESLRWPVTVNLYDQRYRTYNQVVQSLYRYQSSPRNDARLAGKALYDLLAAAGTAPAEEPPVISDLIAQRWINALPNSEFDLDLTATLYLAVPQLLPIRGLQYDLGEGTGAPTGLTGSPSSYYILQAMVGYYNPKAAALGNYSYSEQLNLAIADLLQDDKTAAAKVYDQLVSAKKQSLTGLDGSTVLYIPAQEQDSEAVCTAAALRLALMLGRPDADGFMAYLLEKGSPYDPFIAEQLLYLRLRGPAEGEPVQLQYVLNGQQQTVTLTGAMHTLSLTREALQNAGWKVLSGVAYADVYYTVPPQQSDPDQQKLKVTRTLETVDGGPMKVGSLVKVTIRPDLSGVDKAIGNSMLYLDDYLPSGLRYERFDQRDSYQLGDFWLISQNGQQLRFAANTDSARFGTIVYYARCALPGDFTCEGPFVTSSRGGAWGLGQPDTLTIQP